MLSLLAHWSKGSHVLQYDQRLNRSKLQQYGTKRSHILKNDSTHFLFINPTINSSRHQHRPILYRSSWFFVNISAFNHTRRPAVFLYYRSPWSRAHHVVLLCLSHGAVHGGLGGLRRNRSAFFCNSRSWVIYLIQLWSFLFYPKKGRPKATAHQWHGVKRVICFNKIVGFNKARSKHWSAGLFSVELWMESPDVLGRSLKMLHVSVTTKLVVSPVTKNVRYPCHMSLWYVGPMSPVKLKKSPHRL